MTLAQPLARPPSAGSPPEGRPGPAWHRLAACTAAAGMAIVLWEWSTGDMAFARAAGDAQGFALRQHWLLSGVGHDAMRRLAWVLAAALCAGVWWPWGALRRLPPARRWQLALSVLLVPLAVVVMKRFNVASCPWDLREFGGMAAPLGHWRFGAGAGGHCFPAGHASAGFAFIPGYFAFIRSDPGMAHRWLAASLARGLALGLVQQWRGAHFMSHTLWSGWFCWVVAWSLDGAWRAAAGRAVAV